jgi:hypothetical protein
LFGNAKPEAGGAFRASNKPGKRQIAEGIPARRAHSRTDVLEELISGHGEGRWVDDFVGTSFTRRLLFHVFELGGKLALNSPAPPTHGQLAGFEASDRTRKAEIGTESPRCVLVSNSRLSAMSAASTRLYVFGGRTVSSVSGRLMTRGLRFQPPFASTS